MRARRSRRSSIRPTASSSASAIAPTVEIVLRMPSIDVGSRLTTVAVGVELANRLGDLAVAHRADRAQLLGQDQVGVRGGERVQVELVDASCRRGSTPRRGR